MSDDDLFEEALARPVAERAKWLERETVGDAARRGRVAALLASHDAAEKFFAAPAVGRPVLVAEERPGDRMGNYTLLEKIGEGGCGVVWMAEQAEPVRRRVALKVIKLGMDTREVIARFEAERQALAMMEHPNIAKVFDAGTTATGRPFFVMELVRGVPITRFCDEAKLETEARLKLFIEVCYAIQHAHQKGVIHRDIKPSNILVTQHDEVAVPKVIDFGIAKATQGRLTDATVYTAFAQFIGTPAYMSPEQAEFSGTDVDTRSDIYSLGVLLYELLAGKPPFDPKTLQEAGLDEVRRIIREVEPARPSVRRTAPLSSDLDWIAMKALEKDRTRRYESASALALDVERFLRNEPVTARPPSASYVLRKLVRRHRVAFGAAAAITAVVVLGAAVSTWQAVRATRAEREQGRLRATETMQRQRAEAAELAARRRAYASDINLLQQALAIDNLRRADALLDRQRPAAGETDLRGWEWRYLWQFSRSDAVAELAVAPDTVINTVAVSADGQWLATVEDRRGRVAVRNLATKEEILLGSGLGGIRVAFAPGGARLAIAAVEGSGSEVDFRVWLWDAATRQTRWQLSPARACGGLYFAENGETLQALLVGGQGQPSELVRWQVADGAQVAGRELGEVSSEGRGARMVVSRDGRHAAFASRGDRKIRMIDLATGAERWAAVGAEEMVMALAFSPDGKFLVSGAGFTESAIRIWDTATGREVGRLEGNGRFVAQLEFWPDGRTLVSAGGDQTIRVWDFAQRRLVRTLRGHTHELHSVALLPDGRTLVSSGKDGAVLQWDVQAERAANAAVAIPGSPVAWRFGGAGDAVVTVDAAGRVVERRGANFEQEKTLAQLGRVARAWLPRGQSRVIAWAPGMPVRVWDWERGAMVREFGPEAEGESVGVVAVWSGGERLVVERTRPGRPMVWEEREVTSGRLVREGPGAATQSGAAVSPDGASLAFLAGPGRFSRPVVGGDDADAYVRLEWATGRQTVLRATGSEVVQAGLGFSPDGRWFAAGSAQGFVEVIDAATWRPAVRLTGLMAGMYAPTFAADGERLAIGSSGLESLTLWDTRTWERLVTLPTGTSRLGAVAFSDDGKSIGARSGATRGPSGTEAGFLYVWRAPSWAEIAAAEKVAGEKVGR